MAKFERKGSFESAKLKKTRLKNAKEERVDLLFAGPLEDAISSVRRWVEECLEIQRSSVSFNEFIDDGVILCELVQSIQPGVVKKISRVKSRFAYWENFTFFLKACKSLGLQDCQLFDPEELIGQKLQSGNHAPQVSSERRVKNIVATLYWLALYVEGPPFFIGPKLDCTPFTNTFLSKGSDSSSTNHSSLSSIPDSYPNSHLPTHKSISVSTPNIENKSTSPSSPDIRGSSPLLWIEKVKSKESNGQDDPYCFTQSDANLDNACYRIPSQHSVLSADNSSQDYPSKKRKETLSVRVEAYNPPSAFNADLVFVHDSTSSSVFSPPTENQVQGSRNPFSPNHLGNTFGATDPIDSTGLIIDPLEFHSEVFTAGTDSQESGPHFSSPRPDSTFHVNLTQSSQPDNLSISNTQLDDFTGVSSELPVISEIVPANSSPIDTFDLHHAVHIPNNVQTTSNHSNIEYSHSQEYNEKQIQHIENHTSSNRSYTNETPKTLHTTNNSSKHRVNRSRDSSLAISNSSPTTSTTSSNSSIIVVGYSPQSNSSNSTTPLTKRTLHSNHQPVVEPTSVDRKPPYRRYSSPQQRPGYKPAKAHVIPTENNTSLQSESSSDSEEGDSMSSLNKINRASGKKQMKVLPSNNRKDFNKGLANGVLATDLHATFLPGEEYHGIVLENDNGVSSYPVVKSVQEDTPAFRCGVQSGDQLTKVNDVSLLALSTEESTSLLNKAIGQRKLSLSIHRDASAYQKPHPPQNSTGTLNGNDRKSSPQKLFPRYGSLPGGLDLKRVHSDALPQHQIASTIYAQQQIQEKLSSKRSSQDGSDLCLDGARELESSTETGSRHTLSSIGNDNESRMKPNSSPSLPSVSELHKALLNDHESPIAPLRDFNLRNNPSPVSYLKDEDSFTSITPGKSQSVTELSTISPLPPIHSRDKSDTGINNFYKAHSKAKKTESLPGKFRAQSLNFKEGSPNRSSVSTPGVGLGLNTMAMEDMHSASKLQIDQIWKEVESSSSVVSPVDDTADGQSHMLGTQTPDDDWRTLSVDVKPEPNRRSTMTNLETAHEVPVTREHRSNTVVGLPVRRSSSKANEKKGIESLLTTLRSLNEKVGTYEEEEEFKLLESILQSSKFKKAKELHDNMKNLVTGASEIAEPTFKRVVPISQYVRHFLREDIPIPSKETEELRKLLRKPNIQSTLFCHDKVATQDLYVPSTYFPRSAQDHEDIILTHSAIDLPSLSLYTTKEAPLSRDVPCNRKENATIVYLQRTNRPLGCAIYKDGDSVFVSKILEGCDAEQSGAIREGDELLEVNGIALIGKSNDEIIRLMSGEAGKTVSFTLIPVHDDSADLYYEEKYVRAHFSYNGILDEEIPCKELALNFSRGDILEISNQDDPDWWQARKVFEDGGESLPGLIPARHLQQKREVLKESHAVYNAVGAKKGKGLLSKITRRNKKKKIYYNQGPFNGAFQNVGHEVATYEDVVKLMPDMNRKRPIVLIGAPHVGRRTLIKRIIDSYPRHYSTVVPHITSSPRPGEVDGRDFHFISRDDMERAVQDGRFLDCMETRGCLRGVAISSAKDIIDTGKVPVVDLLPQALKVVGSSGLIPYVVFVAAPRVERLQMTRKMTSEKKKKLQSSFSADYLDRDLKSFTERELIDIYQKSQEIQNEYGHYFDWVVVNDDLQIASDLLLEVARRIEEEPQWVSASWVEEV